MVPKDETVYAFLTDLKHQKNARRSLFARADESPEAVLAYIDSLPDNWEIIFDEAEVADLFAIKKIAMNSLKKKNKD